MMKGSLTTKVKLLLRLAVLLSALGITMFLPKSILRLGQFRHVAVVPGSVDLAINLSTKTIVHYSYSYKAERHYGQATLAPHLLPLLMPLRVTVDADSPGTSTLTPAGDVEVMRFALTACTVLLLVALFPTDLLRRGFWRSPPDDPSGVIST